MIVVGGARVLQRRAKSTLFVRKDTFLLIRIDEEQRLSSLRSQDASLSASCSGRGV